MAPGFKRNRVKAPKLDSNEPTEIQRALAEVVSAVNGQSDEIGKLNGGLALGKATPGVLKKISFLMPEEPWLADRGFTIDAALNHTLQCMMLPGGEVVWNGTIFPKVGTIAVGANLLTVDAGYRPRRQRAIPVYALVGGVFVPAVVLLSAGGVLTYSGGPGAASLFTLDALRYHAFPAAPPHQFTARSTTGSGGEWPLIVRHGLSACRGLWVLRVTEVEQTAQNVGIGAPVVDWVDVGDGTLRINGIWGLQWGRRYSMSLYLTPEEP